ncbi:MAG: hypothetical protein DME97_03990 [Verrucomicrobia bacterium]|nr:MAG: hypothetical protein DME97_03990 [Verrucomicrobiota bacterium]
MPGFHLIVLLPAIAIIGALSAMAADNTVPIWSDGHTSAITDKKLMRNGLSSPKPAYPEEAQKAKATGSGVYELQIGM